MEQVAHLLKLLQKDREKVFVPLKAYDANPMQTTKPAIALQMTKTQDRVLPGNVVFSHNGFVKLGENKAEMTDFISKEQYI